MSLPLIFGTIASLAGSALNNAAQNRYQREALDLQTQKSKELMDYQNELFGTQAQLDTYSRNGFNLGALMNGGNLPLSAPSPSIPSMPQLGTGLMSLKELGSFIADVANAKKAGVDTSKSEQEIRNMQVKEQSDKFELELRQYFAKPQIASELALAYQNVLLAQDTHDLNEIEKAVGEWNKVKSKAEAQSSEHTRDIVKKRLDNTDKELQLANRESEARGTAAYAAANASNTQAAFNKASTEKVKSETYYQNIVNSLKDGIYTEEFDAMLAEARSKKQISEAEEQHAKNMYNRYNHLNENDKDKAAEYLNYMLWWLKNETPSLPIVPLLKLGK